MKGIQLPGEISNNLRYMDETCRKAETEEELKSPLMRVKEKSERADLKLNIKKKKKDIIQFNHFMTNSRRNGGSSDRFHLLGF